MFKTILFATLALANSVAPAIPVNSQCSWKTTVTLKPKTTATHFSTSFLTNHHTNPAQVADKTLTEESIFHTTVEVNNTIIQYLTNTINLTHLNTLTETETATFWQTFTDTLTNFRTTSTITGSYYTTIKQTATQYDPEYVTRTSTVAGTEYQTIGSTLVVPQTSYPTATIHDTTTATKTCEVDETVYFSTVTTSTVQATSTSVLTSTEKTEIYLTNFFTYYDVKTNKLTETETTFDTVTKTFTEEALLTIFTTFYEEATITKDVTETAHTTVTGRGDTEFFAAFVTVTTPMTSYTTVTEDKTKTFYATVTDKFTKTATATTIKPVYTTHVNTISTTKAAPAVTQVLTESVTNAVTNTAYFYPAPTFLHGAREMLEVSAKLDMNECETGASGDDCRFVMFKTKVIDNCSNINGKPLEKYLCAMKNLEWCVAGNTGDDCREALVGECSCDPSEGDLCRELHGEMKDCDYGVKGAACRNEVFAVIEKMVSECSEECDDEKICKADLLKAYQDSKF